MMTAQLWKVVDQHEGWKQQQDQHAAPERNWPLAAAGAIEQHAEQRTRDLPLAMVVQLEEANSLPSHRLVIRS
jgi:hypothetical protein